MCFTYREAHKEIIKNRACMYWSHCKDDFHHFIPIICIFDVCLRSHKSQTRGRSPPSTTKRTRSLPSIVNFDHADGVDPQAALRKPLPRPRLSRSQRNAVKNRSVGWRSALRCIIIIVDPLPPPAARSSSPTPFSRGWNTKQSAFPVSGTSVSIYGCRLPAPTSYDIVSAGSQNLRDRWLG